MVVGSYVFLCVSLYLCVCVVGLVAVTREEESPFQHQKLIFPQHVIPCGLLDKQI